MQTKQSKFPIGWVFAIVAAIAIGLLKFFSYNFQHLGKDSGLGILWSVLLSVLLLAIVGVLVWEKKVSMPLNFRKAAVVEIGMLIVYVFLVFITIILSNHFYVVMGKKDIIKQEVTKQINQMDEMFRDYNRHVDNRVAAYDAYLRQVENNKNSNWSNYVSERLNQYSREDLVVNFKAEIDCGDVQQSIEEWKNDMLGKTNGLGLITLMPRVNEINDNLIQTLGSLKALDRKSEKGANGEPWDYTLTVSNDILKLFGMTKGEPLSVWAFIATIIAAFVMLLPYIAAERDGRHKGLFWELTHSRESVSGETDGTNITGI